MTSSLTTIIFLYFLSCNGSEKIENTSIKLTESTTYNINNDSMKERFSTLSESFYDRDLNKIDSIWSLVLLESNNHIDFLMSFKGDKSESNWYWRDFFVDKNIRYKKMYRPSKEKAALFYINAIFYKDYSFACYRDIYDNSQIDTTLRETDFLVNTYAAISGVDYSKIWAQVEMWRGSSMTNRPFNGTNYFWVGEKGGLLDRKKVLPLLL